MSSMLPSPLIAGDPYDSLRLAWRKSLTDAQVRDLAYEYRIGNYDECSQDAWAEYMDRFGTDASRGPAKEFTSARNLQKLNQSRKRRSRGA